MEAIYSSKTSVSAHNIRRCRNTEDNSPYAILRKYQNLYIVTMFLSTKSKPVLGAIILRVKGRSMKMPAHSSSLAVELDNPWSLTSSPALLYDFLAS